MTNIEKVKKCSVHLLLRLKNESLTGANNHYSDVDDMTIDVSSVDTKNLQEQGKGKTHNIKQYSLSISSYTTNKNGELSIGSVGVTQSP